MAVRTTEAAVKGVLLSDYGQDKDGNEQSLLPFIQTASVIVDRVVTCADKKGITLSTAERELIERWLAAHFYTCSDKTEASAGEEGANSTADGQTGLNLDGSRYGQSAKAVDYSGCLASIDKRAFARMAWLGKRPSEQIPIWQRD